jgi:predicted GNAT family acetyltransferase
MHMTIDIKHFAQDSRFVAIVDGHECVLDYDLRGNVMTIVHTGVPTEVGGRGIAGDITRFALDFARASGWKIVPACSYANAFIQRHHEYADLLA